MFKGLIWLLLHLVGYLYYWQMGFNSVFKGLIWLLLHLVVYLYYWQMEFNSVFKGLIWLLLHLVGYLYYWQMGCNSVFKGLMLCDRVFQSTDVHSPNRRLTSTLTSKISFKKGEDLLLLGWLQWSGHDRPTENQ